MGIAIIGGLIFSLVLTLYVIPTLYTYLTGKTRKLSADTELVSEQKPL
jgi:multidrug efflux pump